MTERTPTDARIFISYRREETAPYAGRLYDRLSEQFGEDQIFMDVDSIAFGLDFVEAITDAVASCDVLLALIGKEWLNATDAQGQRRIDDEHDWVRLEIETALQRNVRVVPVLVDGALMPSSEGLPIGLQPLVRRQALKLSHEYFRIESGRLIEDIKQLALGSRPSAASRRGEMPKKASQPEAVSKKPTVTVLLATAKSLILVVHMEEDHRIEINNEEWYGTVKLDGQVLVRSIDPQGTHEFVILDKGTEVPATLSFKTTWSAKLKNVTLTVGNESMYQS